MGDLKRCTRRQQRQHHPMWMMLSLLVLVVLSMVMTRLEGPGFGGAFVVAQTDEDTSTDGGSTTEGTTDDVGDDYNVIKPKKKKRDKKVDDFDVTNEDWGTYYDPMNVFCGQYDCYKILGFDYENYYTVKPTSKEITQRYRKLSREWHPDKSKHKFAKEKFVKIARAYEVLTSIETRKEYDKLRYDQAAYVSKYGSSVLWTYAPKTDVTIVILIVFIVANIVSWYAQQHRWNMVANRLIKAATEDWLPKDGGTEESKAIRLEAIQILQERDAAATSTETGATEETTMTTNGTTKASASTAKKSKKQKDNTRDKKKIENETLLPIITQLVNDITDFGAGFHQPTWNDLFVVSAVKFPISITTGIVWQLNYMIRRLQSLPYNENEQNVLTQRAVGPIVWNSTSTDEEERTKLVQRQLWKKENLLLFLEEQEVRKLSTTEQKLYYKRKKKGIAEKLE
jgi:DnaJ homolog subfamily C member 25